MVFHNVSALVELFPRAGCSVIARDEYDVRYYFQDLESLIFWLKWSPLPEVLNPERHSDQVTKLIDQYQTPRGIETNEHRELLIVQKFI